MQRMIVYKMESRREERKNCRIDGCIHVLFVVLWGGGGGDGASGLAREHYPFSGTCSIIIQL